MTDPQSNRQFAGDAGRGDPPGSSGGRPSERAPPRSATDRPAERRRRHGETERERAAADRPPAVRPGDGVPPADRRAVYGQSYSGDTAQSQNMLAKAANMSWIAVVAAAIGMLALGMLLLVWPHVSLTVVAILIGAALFVAGAVRLYDGFIARGRAAACAPPTWSSASWPSSRAVPHEAPRAQPVAVALVPGCLHHPRRGGPDHGRDGRFRPRPARRHRPVQPGRGPRRAVLAGDLADPAADVHGRVAALLRRGPRRARAAPAQGREEPAAPLRLLGCAARTAYAASTGQPRLPWGEGDPEADGQMVARAAGSARATIVPRHRQRRGAGRHAPATAGRAGGRGRWPVAGWLHPACGRPS